MRAEGSKLNTHVMTVQGLTTYNDVMFKGPVDIRFTSDTHETLSLTMGNIQIAVGYEKIEELVEETRKDRPRS